MSLINTFLEGEIRREQNGLLQATRDGLEIAKEGERLANRTISEQQASLRQKEEELKKLRNSLCDAEDDLEEYEQLLCKPMPEIAKASSGFAKTYEENQYELADWILSEKSYQELAYRYGALLGKNPSEVRADSSGTREDVLAGRNDPRHQTNAGEFVRRFEERLYSTTPGSKFQAEYNNACEEGRIHRLGDTYRLWSDALDAWLEMAEGGNSAACYNVGRCYGRGDGVDRVPELAERWYLRAHELGDKLAAYNLHLFYTEEKPDPVKAAIFLEESGQRGDQRGIQRIAAEAARQAKDELLNRQEQARAEIRNRLEQAIAYAKDSDEKVRTILCDVPRITRGETHAPVIEKVAEVDPILADRMRCFVGADFKVSESNSRNHGMIFAKWVADVKLSVVIPDKLKRGSLAPSDKDLEEIGCSRNSKTPVDSDLFDLAVAVLPKGEHSLSILLDSWELPGARTTGLSIEVPDVEGGMAFEGVKVAIKGHAFAVIFEEPIKIRGH